MTFFDTNIIYGTPLDKKSYSIVAEIKTLQKELSQTGIKYALVRREEQRSGHPISGNRLLGKDLKNLDNIWGVWSILPEYTQELQAPAEMLDAMKANKIVAWQFLPQNHGFTFHHKPLSNWLKLAEKHNIPIFAEMESAVTYEQLYNILEYYPKLTIILSPQSVRSCDRFIRPFLSEYENIYLELSYYMQSGGLEELVKIYGAARLLFGTGFHRSYTGGAMLLLKHAEISQAAKDAIAYKNMLSIMEKIQYD